MSEINAELLVGEAFLYALGIKENPSVDAKYPYAKLGLNTLVHNLSRISELQMIDAYYGNIREGMLRMASGLLQRQLSIPAHITIAEKFFDNIAGMWQVMNMTAVYSEERKKLPEFRPVLSNVLMDCLGLAWRYNRLPNIIVDTGNLPAELLIGGLAEPFRAGFNEKIRSVIVRRGKVDETIRPEELKDLRNVGSIIRETLHDLY